MSTTSISVNPKTFTIQDAKEAINECRATARKQIDAECDARLQDIDKSHPSGKCDCDGHLYVLSLAGAIGAISMVMHGQAKSLELCVEADAAAEGGDRQVQVIGRLKEAPTLICDAITTLEAEVAPRIASIMEAHAKAESHASTAAAAYAVKREFEPTILHCLHALGELRDLADRMLTEIAEMGDGAMQRQVVTQTNYVLQGDMAFYGGHIADGYSRMGETVNRALAELAQLPANNESKLKSLDVSRRFFAAIRESAGQMLNHIDRNYTKIQAAVAASTESATPANSAPADQPAASSDHSGE